MHYTSTAYTQLHNWGWNPYLIINQRDQKDVLPFPFPKKSYFTFSLCMLCVLMEPKQETHSKMDIYGWNVMYTNHTIPWTCGYCLWMKRWKWWNVVVININHMFSSKAIHAGLSMECVIYFLRHSQFCAWRWLTSFSVDQKMLLITHGSI